MEQFMSWAAILAEHASDADYRKDEDPEEGPRHYLDIDNYPGFLASGRIPQTYDSVVALYGEAFVIDNGVLPWATMRTYDSLVSCFKRFDWEKAVLYASDLGHYVGDAHNPLHITRNYNGQYTNNYGIHSRYETGMINTFQNEILMTGTGISFITDLDDYIFSYIYANYIYVDSIMAADTYAQGVAGNTTSYEYKAALWEKTRSYTVALLNKASNTLAEMIYSAWVDAGKPDMNSGPGIFEFNKKENVLDLKVSPNPVKGPAKFHLYLPERADVKIQIMDFQANLLKTMIKENLPEGPNEFSFNFSSLPEGIYFIMVEDGYYREVGKIIKIN
jgi:hypothetical protein